MVQRVSFHIIPFLFPVMTLLILWCDVGGLTPYAAIAFLLLGIGYSMLDIGLLKRAVVSSIINIYFTGCIVLACGFLFFMMIKAGV